MNKPSQEPAGERYGRLAFAYCKIATVSLLAGRFALPIAASLSAGFFLAAYFRGKKDTKCILKYPLLVASFWLVVLTFWIAIHVWPDHVPKPILGYFP